MKKTPVALITVLVIVLVLTVGVWLLWSKSYESKFSDSTQQNQEVFFGDSSKNQQTKVPVVDGRYNLSLTNSSIEIPESWGFFNSNRDQGDQQIEEYDIMEWLKGPDPSEGYVLSKEKRASLLLVMDELYLGGQLTDEIKQKLQGYVHEFMFSAFIDIDNFIGYLESKDGKAKGFSMINTHGQDVGLYATYRAVLYNKEKQAILQIEKTLAGSEITKLQKRYNNHSYAEQIEIDKEIHQEFTKLVKTTKREELSFGPIMNTIDEIICSWTFN